jgi:hypothetical protein
LFSLIACAAPTIQFPDFDPSLIHNKHNIKNYDEFQISIHPLTDITDIKTFFNSDLVAKNILSVYIYMDNRSKDMSYIVSRDDIVLKVGDNNNDNKYDTSTTGIGNDSAGQKVGMVGGVLLSPILLGIGPGMISEAGTTRHNLLSKEMVPFKTLFPGQAAQGVKYFKIPENISSKTPLNLEVKIKELVSKSTKSVVFNLNLEGTGYDHSK